LWTPRSSTLDNPHYDIYLGDQTTTERYCKLEFYIQLFDLVVWAIFVLEQALQILSEPDLSFFDNMKSGGFAMDFLINVALTVSVLEFLYDAFMSAYWGNNIDSKENNSDLLAVLYHLNLVYIQIMRFCGYLTVPVFGLSAKFLRTFKLLRCIRIWKLMSKIKSLSPIIKSLSSSLSSIRNILILMVFFIIILMLLGMSLFAEHDYNLRAGPTGKFKDLFTSFAIMMQIFTLDNWKVFENELKKTCFSKLDKGEVGMDLSALAIVYIGVTIILMSLIFKNVIAAIIVNEHATTSNDQRWDEKQKILKKELGNLTDAMKETMLENDLEVTNDVDYNPSSSTLNSMIGKKWNCFGLCTSNKVTASESKLSFKDEKDENDFGLTKRGKSDRPNDDRKKSIVPTFQFQEGEDVSDMPKPEDNLKAQISKNNLMRRRSSFGIATGQMADDKVQRTDSLQSIKSDVAFQLAHRRKSGNFGNEVFTTPSMQVLDIMNTISKADIGAGADPFNKEEIHEEELTEAEWDTVIQRHIDMRVTDTSMKTDTVWPRDTLFSYFEIMERLMENLHERQEICNLTTSSLLNIHDTD